MKSLNNAENIPYLAIKVGRLQSNKEGVYLESKRNKAILIFEAWQGKSGNQHAEFHPT